MWTNLSVWDIIVLMNDFVVQEHKTSFHSVHWDLMVRCGEILLTWQFMVPPEKWSDSEIECKKIHDHRLKYLNYEGPISDDRGYVKIVARGQYLDPKGKLLSCLPFDDVELILKSETIHGELFLALREKDCWKMKFVRKDYPCTI